MQPEAVSSHPIASYLGEETNTHLTTTAFQVIVESNKVPPQPLLLQTKMKVLTFLTRHCRAEVLTFAKG